MNIAIGQIKIQPEEIFCHYEQMAAIIAQGRRSQVDLLIFPAFSTTGYLPRETTLFPDFYQDCLAINEKIAAAADNMTIIWGGITYQHHQVAPTVFLAQNGKILFTATPNKPKAIYDFSINGETISLRFCWGSPERITNTDPANNNCLQLVFYENPRQELQALPQEIAMPALYLHNTGLAYEGKQIYVLPGSSSYASSPSKRIASVQPEKTGLFPLSALAPMPASPLSQTANIYHKTICGIHSFMAANHLQKVVIGLSGGIDSALNACLYQQAIGAENLLLINMPSRYNAQLTQDLAKNLSEKLGCFYGVFPIEDSVKQTAAQLEETPLSLGAEQRLLTVSSFTAENVQARDRGSRLLAAIAQSVSGVFTANCNKTEIAVGYATMYGDQAGFLAATGNLWKHEVYDLARYMDEVVYQEPVLEKIIKLKPSAELSPQQDITKGLGDPLIYAYHDKLLAAWEDRETPLSLEEILHLYEQKKLGAAIGCDQELIDKHFPTPQTFINDLEKWWKSYEGMANVKRLQSPPILIVHNPPRALQHHRMHAPYFSPAYLKRKADLLK